MARTVARGEHRDRRHPIRAPGADGWRGDRDPVPLGTTERPARVEVLPRRVAGPEPKGAAVPADARDAARRIVEDVFEGSDPAAVADEPSVPRAPAPTEVTSGPETSPARLRARELVAEVFGPPIPPVAASGASPTGPHSRPSASTSTPGRQRAPSSEATSSAATSSEATSSAATSPAAPSSQETSSAAPRSDAPTAAVLAGRRIVAEAEAAQRARVAAQAAEQALAERTAAEADAASQRERALCARQERRDRSPGESAAAVETGATVQDPPPRQAPAVAPPPPPNEEVLFLPGGVEPPLPEEGEALFDVARPGEDPRLPPSTAADVAGPPPPPQRPPAGPGGEPSVIEVAVDPPAALRPSEEAPVALELPEDPPEPQLAARLASDVLDERDGGTPHPDGDAPEPVASGQRETQALRAGRWVLVTLVAAIALALLFPLAVRAVLELVSLS